jgi:hypothetical protein
LQSANIRHSFPVEWRLNSGSKEQDITMNNELGVSGYQDQDRLAKANAPNWAVAPGGCGELKYEVIKFLVSFAYWGHTKC